MTDDAQHDAESRAVSGLVLAIISIAGAAVGYITLVVAARVLGAKGFENYAVAIAALELLIVISEAGTGKYGFKALPQYEVSKQWSLATGYCRYSFRLVLLISLVLALIVTLSEGLEDKWFWDYPLGIAALFLPIAAVFSVALDFVLANRAAIFGTILGRLLIPIFTLLLLVGANWLAGPLNAGEAVACYGIGSVAGAIICLIAFRWTSPNERLSAPAAYDYGTWLPQCAYFAVIAFLASWVLRINILILELLPIDEIEVSILAAAMHTGTLVVLMSKSTDKLFMPELSIIMEKNDWDYGSRLRRTRLMLMGSLCTIFLAVIVIFGDDILAMYGPEFVAGYPALCLIAIGASVTTLFSMSPVYLRFLGRNRLVLRITIVGAAMMAILTGTLGYLFGATGAGMAFCVVTTLMALVFVGLANSDFPHRESTEPG